MKNSFINFNGIIYQIEKCYFTAYKSVVGNDNTVLGMFSARSGASYNIDIVYYRKEIVSELLTETLNYQFKDYSVELRNILHLKAFIRHMAEFFNEYELLIYPTFRDNTKLSYEELREEYFDINRNAKIALHNILKGKDPYFTVDSKWTQKVIEKEKTMLWPWYIKYVELKKRIESFI